MPPMSSSIVVSFFAIESSEFAEYLSSMSSIIASVGRCDRNLNPRIRPSIPTAPITWPRATDSMPLGQPSRSVGTLGNAKCFTPRYMPINLPPTVCSRALAVDAPIATRGIPISGKSATKSSLIKMRSRSALSSSDAAS